MINGLSLAMRAPAAINPDLACESSVCQSSSKLILVFQFYPAAWPRLGKDLWKVGADVCSRRFWAKWPHFFSCAWSL